MSKITSTKINSKAFTIVEIMIATVMISVILVLVVGLIVSFSNRYYKAVNSSATQSDAQSLLNNIVKAVEYSGSSAPVPTSSGNTSTFCIGNAQFDYNNVFLGTSSNSIWETPIADNPTAGGSCSTLTAPNSYSTSLLAASMQVISLSICALGVSPCSQVSSSGSYTINLVVSFGPDDLICDTSLYSGCLSTGQNTGIATNGSMDPSDIFKCILKQGTQFCDIVDLTTVAVIRLS